MALIQCPECKASISLAAATCPKCGAPAHAIRWMSDPGYRKTTFLAEIGMAFGLVVFVAMIAFVLIGGLVLYDLTRGRPAFDTFTVVTLLVSGTLSAFGVWVMRSKKAAQIAGHVPPSSPVATAESPKPAPPKSVVKPGAASDYFEK